MVEGSLIDSGNHDENLDYPLRAGVDPLQHTLLIVIPDHETGGFAVKGVGPKGGEEPNQGLGPFMAGWTFTLAPGTVDKEAHHTGGDVVIWSEGPGSEALGRAIDNTFVYQVVKEALKM